MIRRIGEKVQYANENQSIFYSDDIYHNQNKDIECEYCDGMDISNNYSGNGYKSGMFIVQFPSGTKWNDKWDIINATESMICAYPKFEYQIWKTTLL